MPTCSSCGRQSAEGFAYCPHCGAPLQAEARPAETRKTVTVVFCDVTGSTALGERLDPESLRKVMGRYFDVARSRLEHHGGTVEKFIGDAVMPYSESPGRTRTTPCVPAGRPRRSEGESPS